MFLFFFFKKNKAQLQEIEYVLSVRLPWEVLLGVASFALTVDLTVVVGFCQLGTNLDTCRKRVPELGKQLHQIACWQVCRGFPE